MTTNHNDGHDLRDLLHARLDGGRYDALFTDCDASDEEIGELAHELADLTVRAQVTAAPDPASIKALAEQLLGAPIASGDSHREFQ